MAAENAPRTTSAVPLRTQVRQLGDYGLVAELARGGMGRVFLARKVGEAGFERLYAIKIMHEHMMDDPEAVLMLLDEANIASQIHHPNVVAITDIGTYEGGYYLVMDYVEGCSLSQLLARNKTKRPPRLIIPLILDALRGLHGAHELTNAAGEKLNLVHRDFSPQNLLIGVDGTCRVTDFGIAKASARLTHTRSSIQKGKIAYMAPEQVTLSGQIDRRADIWAAGVVMWYALTGEHPFRGDTQAATIHSILNRSIVPPSTTGLRPPRCFDHVCLKALQRNQERRYQSAQEMADELQQIAVRHNLLAPPSEIAGWVLESFGEEINQRRNIIRAIKGEGGQVAWINTPVLPRITITPSTGGAEYFLGATRRLNEEDRTPDLRPSPRSMKVVELLMEILRRIVPQRGLGLAILVGIAVGFGLVSLFVRGMTTPLPSSDVNASSMTGRTAQELIRTAEPGPPVGPPVLPAAVNLASEVRPAASREASSPPPNVANQRNEVRILLRGLPPAAEIRLDGTVVNGTEHWLTADGLQHELDIEARGFQTWSREFKATGDVVFDVQLTPRPPPPSRASRSHQTKRTPRRTPSLVRDPGF